MKDEIKHSIKRGLLWLFAYMTGTINAVVDGFPLMVAIGIFSVVIFNIIYDWNRPIRFKNESWPIPPDIIRAPHQAREISGKAIWRQVPGMVERWALVHGRATRGNRARMEGEVKGRSINDYPILKTEDELYDWTQWQQDTLFRITNGMYQGINYPYGMGKEWRLW